MPDDPDNGDLRKVIHLEWTKMRGPWSAGSHALNLRVAISSISLAIDGTHRRVWYTHERFSV